jgi:hypothetical protein
MLPADWLEYIAQAERESGRRPDTAPRKPQGVGRDKQGRGLMSPRQRQAFRQTANPFRAAYEEVDERKFTATTPENNPNLTLNVGASCEPLNSGHHGRRTR